LVDVFISYPRVERSKTELIKAKLDALGLDTFFDIHGIDGGDTFPDVIDRALKSAKAVLGVWSPRAFQSKWCMIECRVGATRGVLVPIALERFSELDMKSDFMTTNYLDLTDFDGRESHEGWQRTLRSLSRHVGRELGGAASSTPQRQTPTSPAPPVPTPPAPPKNVPLPDGVFPELVRIPPWRFLMGSPGSSGNEGPQHQVRINYAFELGKYPVTFAEWDAALAAGAALENPSDEGWGRDRRPVINVSWKDAHAYIEFLNEMRGVSGRPNAYRLPSEAEWEYSCRAGTTTDYSTGARINEKQARFKSTSTAPVGSFPANAFGLHDMHGNVWEWCEDAWNVNYSGAPTDGSAWLTGDASSRVLRGGSWNDYPGRLRSADRSRDNPTNRYDSIGFRVARTL
jgi:formylglycine-generating enzyme required for sulfatase activity